MTLNRLNSHPKVTAELIAEAAAWLAVLHGPNRTATTERGFAQWLKKTPSHSQAFEEATGIWEEARNLSRPGVLHHSFRKSPRPRSHLFFKFASAAAVLALVAGGWALYLQRSGVGTEVGELRLLALRDGTRIILNTRTRVVVSYNRDVRHVELKEGEALFEVARKPNWPFVVTAGDRKIEALGTSFAVRREAHHVAVTLVEGKVAVSAANMRGNRDSSAARPRGADVILTPGERAIFADAQPVKTDRPQLEKLLAWQRREVAFDDRALSDATAEMNRYNRKPLWIAATVAANARVTGLFRAGDSMSFARAVAEAYHLEVVEEPDKILLSRTRAADPSSVSQH